MKDSSQKLGTNPLFAKVAGIYGVSEKQAESIVAYHGAFRLNAGSLLNASRNVGYFETKEGNASKGIGFLAKIASLFPGGAVAEIGAEVAKGIDEFRNEYELAKVAQIAMIVESDMATTAIRDLATRTVESSINGIKNLSPKEARDLAKRDVAHLKQQMIGGKFDELASASQAASLLLTGNQEIVKNLVDAMWLEVGLGRGKDFIKEKEQSKKTKSAAENNLDYKTTHPILGPHSQEVVHHHQLKTTHIH